MLDLEEIYHPIADDLFDDCPEEIRPLWRASIGRGHYYFPSTDSRLYLFGVDNQHFKKGRGKKTHLAVVDEAGFCEPACADGVLGFVNSILLPQTFGADGCVIIATTPAETPAHPSTILRAQAEQADAFFRRTIDDTAHYFGPQTVEEYAQEAGGRDSTTWKREYLCQEVVDESRAVIPEWNDSTAITATGASERPPYFRTIVSQDPGFAPSNWAVLFGYYDFQNARLVIEDELEYQRARTDTVAGGIKAKEAELWPDRKVDYRWSDIDLILLNDLGALHGLYFAATSKDDLNAMVNQVRIWVRTDRIRIHPRCKGLLAQLRVAVWNKQRSAFEFSGSFGHYDLLAALIYAVRNAPVQDNPYPLLDPGVTHETHHIPGGLSRDDDVTRAALRIVGRR